MFSWMIEELFFPKNKASCLNCSVAVYMLKSIVDTTSHYHICHVYLSDSSTNYTSYQKYWSDVLFLSVKWPFSGNPKSKIHLCHRHQLLANHWTLAKVWTLYQSKINNFVRILAILDRKSVLWVFKRLTFEHNWGFKYWLWVIVVSKGQKNYGNAQFTYKTKSDHI